MNLSEFNIEPEWQDAVDNEPLGLFTRIRLRCGMKLMKYAIGYVLPSAFQPFFLTGYKLSAHVLVESLRRSERISGV